MADIIRRHLRVTGRVQGVFFRDSTRQVAASHGTTGWVRNDPDGSVVAEVQGPARAVAAVIAFVREGPPRAHVADVVVQDRDPVADETSFRIR